MKYLKKFNEGSLTSTLTTEMVADLRDFCRDHLAYLIDEGFTVRVTPTFYGNECDIFIFKEVTERFTDIVTNDWSSIKDQIIPFLYMLNKHYTIIESEDDHYNRRFQRFFTIQPNKVDSFINDTIDDFKLKQLKIRVDFKDKSIKEAISQQDLKDFCEQYLAYLLDDGYVLDFREAGRVTQIDLVKPKENPLHGNIWSPGQGGSVDWMDWDHIKDHFIPFLKMLDREYDVKDNLITFQTRGAVQVKISFQDVIDDKVEEKILSVTKFKYSTTISSIRIPLLDQSVGQYSWQLKEAKEDWRRNFPDDELQEVCDRFLPYLYDEGFEVMVTIPTYFMFKKNIITLWKEQEKGDGQGLHIIPFYWHEIKDRFLPLFDYLNKYYPLGSVKLVSYEPPRLGSSNKKALTFRPDNSEEWTSKEDKANIMGFSILEEVMSRDNAYGRPMKIGEIIIEVQNLGEL